MGKEDGEERFVRRGFSEVSRVEDLLFVGVGNRGGGSMTRLGTGRTRLRSQRERGRRVRSLKYPTLRRPSE